MIENIKVLDDIFSDYHSNIDAEFVEKIEELKNEFKRNEINIEKNRIETIKEIQKKYSDEINDTKRSYFEQAMSLVKNKKSEYDHKTRFLEELGELKSKAENYKGKINILDKALSQHKISNTEYKKYKEKLEEIDKNYKYYRDYQDRLHNICFDFAIRDSVSNLERNKSFLNIGLDELKDIVSNEQDELNQLYERFKNGKINEEEYDMYKNKHIIEYYRRVVKSKFKNEFENDRIMQCANEYLSSINKDYNIDNISSLKCEKIKKNEQKEQNDLIKIVNSLLFYLNEGKITHENFIYYVDKLGYSRGTYGSLKENIESTLREMENEKKRKDSETKDIKNELLSKTEDKMTDAELKKEETKKKILCESIIDKEDIIIDSIIDALKMQEKTRVEEEKALEIKYIKENLANRNDKIKRGKNSIRCIEVPVEKKEEFLTRVKNNNFSVEYINSFYLRKAVGIKNEFITFEKEFNEFISNEKISNVEELYKNNLDFKYKAIDELKTKMNGMLSDIISEYEYNISGDDIVNEFIKPFELTSYVDINKEYEDSVSLIEETYKNKNKRLDEDVKEAFSNCSKEEQEADYMYFSDDLIEKIVFHIENSNKDRPTYIPLNLFESTTTLTKKQLEKEIRSKKIDDEKKEQIDIAGQKLRNSVDVISIFAGKEKNTNLNQKTLERIDQNDLKIRLPDILKMIINKIEEHDRNIEKIKNSKDNIDSTDYPGI